MLILKTFNKLDDNGVPVQKVRRVGLNVGDVLTAAVTQAAGRCLDSSMFSPCGNMWAALISLRSEPKRSRATDRVESGLLLTIPTQHA